MSTAASEPVPEIDGPTFLGHPTGLFMLFFAEMWERFSYYGMRALLVLYMVKGFLSYNDGEAYLVYGAYTSLVYATPFIGGMLADRLLGSRKAVILGGLLMAAGHLVMTIESSLPFFTALALLIVGNGFFKPNISTIVGSLYPEGHPGRDGGFTIFYIGINLGAAMAPLLCGYVGENYGWHYGFGLATIGMLVGLAVFVAPAGVTRLAILAAAALSGGSMIYLNLGESIYALVPNAFVGLYVIIAGIVAFLAIGVGSLPEGAGAPPDPAALKKPLLGPLNAEWSVYLGALLSVPVLALLVQRNEIAGYTLMIFGGAALLYLVVETVRSSRVERDRLIVVLVLMFFSMLFWAFFEQAGSSVNLFTDRNIDRVAESATVTSDMIGTTVDVEVTQALSGHTLGEQVITMTQIDAWKEEGKETVSWTVSEDDVGMTTAGSEIATSMFQAANPTYILIFGLGFSVLWTFLGKRGLEPSTPVKFALGIGQLGLGFGVLWWGAQGADAMGMVNLNYLMLSYLLITTGELCLSPVGLSMVTKLAPARIVSMVMGAWFLATAFSNYLAALIALFTGVGHGEEGAETALPPPIETVHVYGDVFGTIAVAALVSAVVVFILSPFLSRMMHPEVHGDASDSAVGGH